MFFFLFISTTKTFCCLVWIYRFIQLRTASSLSPALRAEVGWVSFPWLAWLWVLVYHVIIVISGTVDCGTHFPVFQYFLKITPTHKMNGNGSSLDRWKICQSLLVTRSGLPTGKYTNHWVKRPVLLRMGI